MDLAELIAREQIRDTLSRYAQYADGGRFDDLVALFTEDGVLAIDGRAPLQGRVAIRDFLGRTKSSLSATLERPYIRHHLSSIVVEMHSDREATVSSYFLAITASGPDHWGRYRDPLVQVGQCWLFANRRVRPDGHADTSWRATRRTVP